MSEPVPIDAGLRYAFAPDPEPVECVDYRIHAIFEATDARCRSTGTDLMLPTLESAQEFCDGLNARLGFRRPDWTAFADRVFTERTVSRPN